MTVAPTALEPLDLDELLAGVPPETRWLWKGWIAQGDLVLLVGDPGVGKSLLALALADAVRRGAELLDEPCEQGAPGVFDLENPLPEVHARLYGFGLRSGETAGLAYFHAVTLDVTTAAGIAQLETAVEQHGLRLLVLDSLRRLAPRLDENSSADVAAVLGPLRRLTASGDLTILIVHHARKRYGDNPAEAGQMVRGSGDLVASVDTLLYVRAKEAGAFTLEVGKSRRGAPHEPILVRIEHDDDGLRLVNEGAVAAADDKVEATLARIVEALRADGGPLDRPTLALRIGVSGNAGTFSRALNLGWQREQLAKTAPGRVGQKTLYALATESSS